MPKIRRVGYLLAALLAVTALTAFIWKPAPPAKFVGLTGSQLPLKIGSYTGVDVPVDAATLAAIPSADIIQRRYTGADGSLIDVTIIGGTGRNQLHDPRSCLVGAGWQIVNDHVEELPDGAGVPIRSCQIVSNGSDDPLSSEQSITDDLVYLYVVNKQPIASASTIRWTLLKSDILEQNDDPVYFLRAIEEVPSSSQGLSAKIDEHRRLTQFTAGLWKELSPVIYQGERS